MVEVKTKADETKTAEETTKTESKDKVIFITEEELAAPSKVVFRNIYWVRLKTVRNGTLDCKLYCNPKFHEYHWLDKVRYLSLSCNLD